jgi:ferredoxin-thioredoxin reductase catalytic chain
MVKKRVFELLEALITNKDCYGHMAFPCRLASGSNENNRDVICPCVYWNPYSEAYYRAATATFMFKQLAPALLFL